MEDKKDTGRKGAPQTAWHPLFAELLSFHLPEGYRLLSEYQLTREPQRVDVVVWEAESEGGPYEGIPVVMKHLSARNLFEFKSPTDRLERIDLSMLTGYGMQYYALEGGFALSELTLFLVAPRVTGSFRQGLDDWDVDLEEVEPGLHRCDAFPWQLWVIESDVAWKTEGNQTLGFFTHTFLKDPTQLAQSRAFPDWMYPWLAQQMAEYRERSREMPLAKREEFEQRMRDFMKQHLASMPLEERLEGISATEILKAVPAEEILKAVPAEEILKAVPAEQRKALKKLLDEEEAEEER